MAITHSGHTTEAKQAFQGRRTHSLTTGESREKERLPLRAPKRHARGDGTLSQEQRLSYGLAWFGIGLGLVELVAPRSLARLIGVPSDHHTMIRAMGLREISSGLGILTQPASAAGVWSRVAGDAIDMVSLVGTAVLSNRAHRGRIAAATAAVAGAAILDILCAQQLTRKVETRGGAIRVHSSLAINQKAEDLYRFWREFSNLPLFMKNIRSVQSMDDKRSHWEARGPAGSAIEWDADIVDDRPNELIAWRSTEHSDVSHEGSVRFQPAPGNRGTLVTVTMQYRPPGGTLGAGMAAWFGTDPRQAMKTDLRRFKQIMELGEILTTEGQPAGRASSTF